MFYQSIHFPRVLKCPFCHSVIHGLQNYGGILSPMTLLCKPTCGYFSNCSRIFAHLKLLMNLRPSVTGTCHITFDGHTAPVKSVGWIDVGKLHQN